MSDFKQTMKWLSRVTKDNFNNVVNDNINITFDKGFKIMSFNVRRDSYTDDLNNWEYRKSAIVKMISEVAPDIICMQEVMPHMAKYLSKQLSKYYEACGVECFTGREITKSLCVIGEGLLTLYRKDRFFLKNHEVIKLYDGRLINLRRAYYVSLYDWTTRQTVEVYNTHFCHKSDEARSKSFNKLYNHWEHGSSDAQFFCGDFNCEIYQTEAGIDRFSEVFTYNEPDKEGTINFFSGPSRKTIDFIFGSSSIESTQVIRSEYNGRKFLSDHWPVVNTY